MSEAQNQWIKICAAARGNLIQHVALMGAMNTGEIAALMTAISTAQWNEIMAQTYDEAVEEKRASLERAIAFGG